jgi:hypothetical protein
MTTPTRLTGLLAGASVGRVRKSQGPTSDDCPKSEGVEPLPPASPPPPVGVASTVPPTVAGPFGLLGVLVALLTVELDFFGVFTMVRGVVDVEVGFVAKLLTVVFVDFLAFFDFFVARFETNPFVPVSDDWYTTVFDLPTVVTLCPRVSGLAAEVVGAGESDRRSGASAR